MPGRWPSLPPCSSCWSAGGPSQRAPGTWHRRGAPAQWSVHLPNRGHLNSVRAAVRAGRRRPPRIGAEVEPGEYDQVLVVVQLEGMRVTAEAAGARQADLHLVPPPVPRAREAAHGEPEGVGGQPWAGQCPVGGQEDEQHGRKARHQARGVLADSGVSSARSGRRTPRPRRREARGRPASRCHTDECPALRCGQLTGFDRRLCTMVQSCPQELSPVGMSYSHVLRWRREVSASAWSSVDR